MKTRLSHLGFRFLLLALFSFFLAAWGSAYARPRFPEHRKAETAPSPPLSKTTSSRSKEERIFGAQVFRLPGNSPAETETFILKLKKNGFNTVLLRVFHMPFDRLHAGAAGKRRTSGVYFKTSLAPFKGDVLGKTAKLCHKHGLKIFAWMLTREIPWDFPGKSAMLETRYDFASGRMERGKGLDVFNPAVRAYLRALYRDLAREDIDGVLLQDDLVLRHNVGFGPDASVAFLDKTDKALNPKLLYAKVLWPNGRNAPPRVVYTDAFWQWSKLKSDAILLLVSDLRRSLQEVKPNISLALNTYYDSVLTPGNGLAWLSQDVAAWSRSPVDYFAVMAYHRQMVKELDGDFSKSLLRLKAMRLQFRRWGIAPSRVMMKLQARDWKSGADIPIEELRKVYQSLDDGKMNFVVAPVEENWNGLADGFPFGDSSPPP